nr:protein YLS9-like [Ipomoea trifida]
MGDQTRPQPVTGYPAGPANQNGYPPPSSGTAYPYAAPPPAAYNYNYYNNNNPYYQQPDAYAVQRATFLRRVLAIFIACFVIAGAVIFIVWLILRPRLPEVRADSLSLSSFNLSDNFLSGNWDFQFTARNPNKKMTIDYDDIQASIYYDSKQLAETSVAPFFQDKRSETASKATFAATRTFVDDRVVEGIKKETPNIEFDVLMLARVKFKAGSWRARSRFLRVYCGELKVVLVQNKSSGNLVGDPRQCVVRL